MLSFSIIGWKIQETFISHHWIKQSWLKTKTQLLQAKQKYHKKNLLKTQTVVHADEGEKRNFDVLMTVKGKILFQNNS